MAINPRTNPKILKLCLMGEGGVGKTTLCNRILTGVFNPATKMTIGIDFQLLKLTILDPFSDTPQKIQLEIQIWDFGGEDRFRFMLPRFVKGATGALLLYDLSRYSTTKYLPEWYQIWTDNSEPDAPIYLVGSKFDNVSEEEKEMVLTNSQMLQQQYSIKNLFLTSAKSGYSIDALVDAIIKEMYMYNMKKLHCK
jgi:small GTP-binding protein